MTGGHAHGATPPVRKDVSAGRLMAVLGGSGAVAGALILIAFTATDPAIQANRARRLDAAISEVLKGPARYDTLYVVGDALAPQPPAGVDPASAERVFLGHDEDGTSTGYAIVAEAPGFADVVRVIFGYDPATRTLIGMKVLENKETPGLGDKIEKDSAFVTQFEGVLTPLVGVKPGGGKGDSAEVDMITGATISSRTIIKIINQALERLGPALAAQGATAP
jgi:electron transport complex protein RnfG